MSNHHGKLIYYQENREFLDSLPKRSDFTDKKMGAILDMNIKNGKNVVFHPNDILETHHKSDGRLSYKLLLIGILRDGSKAAVVLNGIEPFFDVRIPHGLDKKSFMIELKTKFSNNKINKVYPIKYELFEKYPFKYYQESTSDFVRIYFYTLHSRIACLNYILENDLEFSGKKYKLETASNDKSCYYRKVAREYKFKLCNWNLIKNYELDTNQVYCKKTVKYVFQVDVENFIDLKKIVDISLDPKKYQDMLRDASIVLGWDTETDSLHPTGNAPLPEFVLDKDGNEEDVIRMLSAVLYWHHSNQPLVVVNITDLICPARNDCMTIICKNQQEIIKVYALIVERMCPEFIIGFNDGFYDWPFVLRRAERYGLIDFMKKHMTVLTLTPENMEYAIVGAKKDKIKVEANTYIDTEFFLIPGFICADVRTIFRRIYPTAEHSSLNYFLALNKLGSKEDMPYQTMFKILRLMRKLAKYFKTNIYEVIFEELQKLPLDFIIPTENTCIDTSPYSIDNLKVNEMIELAKKATDVGHYCNVDSKRCQDLFNIRAIIPDAREVSDLAYTSMFDAWYRAGGMKVRNLVIAKGIEPEWNFVFDNSSSKGKDLRKYPGGFVVPPKKGLYRDHKLVKRSRRESFRKKYPEITLENLTPSDPKFIKELLDPDFNDLRHA